MLGQRRFAKLQTAVLVAIALVMGANLISPAVAHVTRKLNHLYKHLDPRYVNVGETVARADNATNATNAGNADTVDTYHANELIRTAYARTATCTISTTESSCGAVTITAPKSGVVKVDGSSSFQNSSCTSLCDIAIRLQRVGTAPEADWQYASVPGSGNFGSATAHKVFTVPAGTNTFNVLISRNFGTGSIVSLGTQMTAVYSPFGPTGARLAQSSMSGSSGGGPFS
jgi:hypothetical protein